MRLFAVTVLIVVIPAMAGCGGGTAVSRATATVHLPREVMGVARDFSSLAYVGFGCRRLADLSTPQWKYAARQLCEARHIDAERNLGRARRLTRLALVRSCNPANSINSLAGPSTLIITGRHDCVTVRVASVACTGSRNSIPTLSRDVDVYGLYFSRHGKGWRVAAEVTVRTFSVVTAAKC